MEKRYNVFDFLTNVLMIFGISVIALNIFCIWFGNTAKEHSQMFALGSDGLSAKLIFEFLGLAVIITFLRLIFFTDILFKRMALVLRTFLMLMLVLVVMSVAIILFQWFPVNAWEPWAMFLLCFAISFVVSLFIMTLKEKLENSQMEDALKKLKAVEKSEESKK